MGKLQLVSINYNEWIKVGLTIDPCTWFRVCEFTTECQLQIMFKVSGPF